MDEVKASKLLGQLAQRGVPPRDIADAGELLPLFSVGLDDWIERLSRTYFQQHARSDAHFKLVLAPYGGGKTHFLMALTVRALQEGFAAAFVTCAPDRGAGAVRVDKPLGLYAAAVGSLQIPGRRGQGIPALLQAVVEIKRQEIDASGAANPQAAFNLYLRQLKRDTFPSGRYGDFAAVVSHALSGYWEDDGGDLSSVAAAAEKWLEGRMDALTRDDWQLLALRRVTAAQADALGRTLLLAMARLTQEAGCYGLALLVDEVETLLTAKGRARDAVLGAMRIMVDYDGAPLLCVAAATPDISSVLPRYLAVQTRLAVAGAPFDEGNDFAPQIQLDRLGIGHEPLLQAIGERLVDVACAAAGASGLNRQLQQANARLLAKVAARMNLDVDARRLYVKTWAGLLQLQISTGERSFEESDLVKRYRGDFDSIRAEDERAFEP